MSHFLTAIALLIGLTSTAFAQCSGTDLRPTLTAEEDAAIEAELAQTPFAVGNHWIAEKDGEVIHLIGTMHLSDPRLDAPYTRLRPVVQAAGKLLLEMTKDEEAKMQAALASRMDMLILQDTSLPELLDEGEWQMLSAAMRARGMPPVMGAKMQPWYVSMLLSIPTCLQSAMQERNGLDARLEALAGQSGVPTGALEPFDTAFEAFAAVPLEMQMSMLLASLTEPGTSVDLFETLLSGYFDESHAEIQMVLERLSPRLTPLDDAESKAVFDMMDDTLVKARNTAWIPVILEAAAETEGPVVAAFGAAHLGGEDGVLKLLQAAGFSLRRAAF
ncbi:TraB/GumN family protein [Tropicibacter alexandrii]|uniref:TraB/GumN family protein n=1 Tax=Tropicibacter alexandrii TaxID=2267683 RepID=UPI000EF50242|nr:TraB/GumN family protein [Tropicibacter alexandrii]